MKKTCFLVCVYATLLFFTATSGAQDRVTALVTAVDRSGEAVQLSAADLDITEDGKTISSAVDVRELKTSRRIILIFDASHSGDRSFDFARSTAKSLTYNLMRGGLDTASLVVLHDGRWSDQLWTGNPDAVLNSLASLTPSGKTALYDGILRAWELFERTPASGEHIDILLVLSDGEDNSSSATKFLPCAAPAHACTP